MNKIILAYSGGLDTTVILKWLQENYDAEVITYTADLGQNDLRDDIEARAKQAGASLSIIEDLASGLIFLNARSSNCSCQSLIPNLCANGAYISCVSKAILRILS